MTGPASLPADEERAVAQFIYTEARLLDTRRFEAWLELFDEDGVYWVPGQPDQQSPRDALSLFYEHKTLLAVRIARLGESAMHAQSPISRTHHQVSAVAPLRSSLKGIDYEAHSSLIVCEWRNDEGRWFAGTVTHMLRRRGDVLRIVSKRVDLINCDAPHRALAIPF